MTKEDENLIWPINPYKGLSYYGPEDFPIFSGRDDDVERIGRIIGDSSSRICIMHGSTGCGKSSFLRAGLIPFLQREDHGFYFVKEEGPKGKALFVRSSDDPLTKLAECLYEFISEKIKIKTPIEYKFISFTEDIENYSNKKHFVEQVGNSPQEMVAILNTISKKLPKTLVLIVDQGEEILTIKPKIEGDEARERFFKFLAIFDKINIDIKILIALRTEYYGRFIDKIRNRDRKTLNTHDYLLQELSEESIEKAILRPTLLDTIPGYGIPREQYHFNFEKNLPNKIAKDLRLTNPSGGILPAMQVVCNNLYQNTKINFLTAHPKDKEQGDEIWKITKDEYNSLGGVEGQIGSYLDRVLDKWMSKNSISRQARLNEKIYWKTILFSLVKTQVDGTVTTELKIQDDLMKIWKEQNSKLNFKNTLEYFTDPNQRILIKVEKFSSASDKLIPCYVLGHDAIGLVLKSWYFSDEREKSSDERVKKYFFLLGVSGVLMGSFAFMLPLIIDALGGFGDSDIKGLFKIPFLKAKNFNIFGGLLVIYGFLFALMGKIGQGRIIRIMISMYGPILPSSFKKIFSKYL